MMDVKELMDIIGNTFFGGDAQIAGIVVFSIIVLVILALTRRAFITLVIVLPVTFIFTSLGVLPQDLMILLIIVAVLGLAMTARGIWRE